eukprot:3941905-Rhodomonas_salina.3
MLLLYAATVSSDDSGTRELTYAPTHTLTYAPTHTQGLEDGPGQARGLRRDDEGTVGCYCRLLLCPVVAEHHSTIQ